jgi:pSer/pThr/pTyr-binding forkhead associated (FHA) protein
MSRALVFESGPRAGERIDVHNDVLLGRENADVVVADTEVSRQHALIRLTTSAVEIEDLGSRNGTWVNGERLAQSRVLQPGDSIRVGQTSLRFEAVIEDPGETLLSTSPAAAMVDDQAALEPPPPPAPVPTSPPMQSPRRVASRQTRASVLSFGVVVATAIALVAYFAGR